jgi:hypothetical protein
LSEDLSPGKDISYYPDPGFVGNDKVIFLVDIESHKVKVVYFIKVLAGAKDAEPLSLYRKYCPDPSWWQMSLPPSGASLLTQSWLNLDQSNITVTFGDLGGSAVGEETSDGSRTNITLDTNAAGNGWFIDPTPADNSEFLPTANPDVWMAKAGTDAAGKMDMLSVLLHEYGHALGLDHSANPNDFMAPNLQPGERRLPSSAELAQLSRLSNSLSSVPSPLPSDPALPVGTALSALLIGRLRRTDYGSFVPVIDSIQIPAPQFERAVTLCNLSVTLK